MTLKLGLDNLTIGVILCDMQRNITYINESAVKILSDTKITNDIRRVLPDFNADNLIGKCIDLFHVNPVKQINILNQLTHTAEYKIIIGGHLLSVKTTALIDKTDKRIGYMAEVEDITEREINKVELIKEIENNKKLNHQVLQMQKLESINRLTAGIAHDFNNFLMAITGYNELNKYSAEDVLLESKCRKKLNEELLENIRQIKIASGKASSLIEKMLLYCRRDGDVEVHYPVLDLNDVLRENIKMLRVIIPNMIVFEIDLVEQTFDLSNLDETYLNQIIVNLFVNARDALNGKGIITLKTSMSENTNDVCSCCHAEVNGQFVEISVKDNGSGIESDIARRIFDPFYTTKPVGEGTGLGLSVIAGILHNLGGHIVLESEVGVGTTFRLFFPLVNAA